MGMTAAVAGASGAAGGELLRLISRHPNFELGELAAASQAGKPVIEVHSELPELADRVFEPTDPDRLGTADVAFLALPLGEAGRLAEQLPSSVRVVDLGPDYRGSLDDYLGRSSSKLRAKIRREMRGFEATGWRTEVTPLADCLAEVAALVSKVEEHHGHSTPAFLLKRLLERESEYTGARQVVLTCREEHDEMVACAVNYAWRGTLYSRCVGLDYERLGGGFAYFNLLIYRSLQYAAEHGMDRLQLGQTSTVKAERGATTTPLWMAAVPLATQHQEPGIRIVDPGAAARWSEPYQRYSQTFPSREWTPESAGPTIPYGQNSADP
jgi:hypothetical protein